MSLYTNQSNRMNPYDVEDSHDSIPVSSGLAMRPAAAAASFPASTATSSSAFTTNSIYASMARPNSIYASMNNENEAPEESFQYWEEDGWRPLNKSGTQRSPNQIRAELQKYIDNSSQTQTAITEGMGINNNSFRKFMNPKTYKNQWSATANGTYWAAAKLLEQERNRPKTKASKVNGKRKGDADNDNTNDNNASNKKSKTEIKLEMMTLMYQVVAVEGVNEHVVYDSCIQIVKKVKAFLAQDGVTKVDFCLFLGGVNSNSLNRFLAGKAQDQAENITYRRAYAFFEKKRILEGDAKSKARIKNEMEHASGFALERPRKQRWFYGTC